MRRPIASHVHSCRFAPSCGLTLIELVVTLSIIGLIVIVSIPALGGLLSGEGSGAAEPARELLVEAARRSRLNASEVEVIIAPESGRYLMEERAPGRVPIVEEGVLPLVGVRGRGPRDRFRVLFNPLGLGVGDTLHFSDGLLVVDPFDGSVRVTR